MDSRFWRYVNKDGPILPGMNTACWVWTGATFSTGYGHLARKINGKHVHLSAHRVSLELALGRPIEAGKLACHRCDNRLCVRYDHLFEGTAKDNTQDSIRKGRARRGHNHGASNGRAKLTEADVASIREEASKGVPRIVLARRFSTCRQTIANVLTGATWKGG